MILKDVIGIQDPGKDIEVYRGSYSETKKKEEWLSDPRFLDQTVDKVKDRITDTSVHIQLRA